MFAELVVCGFGLMVFCHIVIENGMRMLWVNDQSSVLSNTMSVIQAPYGRGTWMIFVEGSVDVVAGPTDGTQTLACVHASLSCVRVPSVWLTAVKSSMSCAEDHGRHLESSLAGLGRTLPIVVLPRFCAVLD